MGSVGGVVTASVDSNKHSRSANVAALRRCSRVPVDLEAELAGEGGVACRPVWQMLVRFQGDKAEQ